MIIKVYILKELTLKSLIVNIPLYSVKLTVSMKILCIAFKHTHYKTMFKLTKHKLTNDFIEEFKHL